MKLLVPFFLLPSTLHAFTPLTRLPQRPSLSVLHEQSEPDMEQMKKMLIEESTNPENMKAAADMVKNMQPEEVDSMIAELERMPDEQFKAMGMDKNILRQSLDMIKDNPEMMSSMSDMMSSMSPDELFEKSRRAQQDMTELTATAPTVVDVPTPSPKPTGPVMKSATEESVVDAMFAAAELISTPPEGGATYAGFRALPIMSLLVGTDTESDLSEREAKECWADGSLGATRVDRQGFQRVWDEVREYFDDDIMQEARERAIKATRRRGGGAAAAKPAAAMSTATPTVGANLSPEVLEQQVKNMSDSDIDTMLKAMKDMSPEEEARMKAMGVNPAMMKKTAEMMNKNPLMRNAAKMMMKNMSADQMLKASEQVQSQMKNMSDDEMNKMMKELDKRK